MNNLKNFNWKTRYNSEEDNLIEDFFVPALSRSKFYYRIAGYFSSLSILAALRGIDQFVEKGEKIYLVIGNELTKEDADAINRGEKGIGDVLNKKWEECKKDLNNDFVKKNFQLLAWLIHNKKLEIKVGINKDSLGNYIPSEKSKFHEKIMIFEDYDGNYIQTDGSINETWKAWKENRESFCVHKSWIQGNNNFIKSAKEEFDRIWSNLGKGCETIKLPEAIEKNLLSLRSKHEPSMEINFSEKEFIEYFSEKEKKTLRKYQKEAIEAWKNKECKGLLEMATGTGKTYTAIKAMETLDLSSKFLIVGVPQKELANQWADSFKKEFENIPHEIIICNSSTRWKKEIDRNLRQIKEKSSLGIIIVTFGTMRTEKFLEAIKDNLEKTYLILDEVHEMGSIENSKILENLFLVKYRLGLSATPERVWDEEGNKKIRNFLNCEKESTFIWDMEKAINPPEGYEKCLCEYDYHLHDCSLSSEELKEYEEFSIKISRIIGLLKNSSKNSSKDYFNNSQIKKFLQKRAIIVKKCQAKYRVLKDILDNNSQELSKCLVYCNDKKHLDEVYNIIAKRGFKCKKFYGELNEEIRRNVFDSFKNEDTQFIVAIKCLDQGIDLPICNSAIILTSSTNPREYIQRRGRILRLKEGKEYAIVHDVFVFPHPVEDLKGGNFKLEDFEANLLDNQLQRIKIFIKNSRNRNESYLSLLEYGELIENSRIKNE